MAALFLRGKRWLLGWVDGGEEQLAAGGFGSGSRQAGQARTTAGLSSGSGPNPFSIWARIKAYGQSAVLSRSREPESRGLRLARGRACNPRHPRQATKRHLRRTALYPLARARSSLLATTKEMMLIGPRFLSSSSPPSSTRHETLLPALSTPPEPCRILSSYSPDGPTARRGRTASSSKRPPPDLRRLTARIVDLTRRRQLDQVMAEVEASKRRARAGRGGGINIIVMNAVLEACVSCGDVDLAVQLFEDMRGPRGCGADGVSYGILLKGLGIARRIDEAFEILESIEKDASVGSPKLTPHLICGFLNALIEAGDMRRANALVARFRQVLYKGHSVLLYNLLMKGYIKSNFPLGALTVKDEILRQGLKPDRLTYNTIIFACVKASEIDKAFRFLEDMKVSHKCWKGRS